MFLKAKRIHSRRSVKSDSKINVGRRRQRNRRKKSGSPKQAECTGLIADTLEERVLLSAATLAVTGVATPTYINEGLVNLKQPTKSAGVKPEGMASPSPRLGHTTREVQTAYGVNNIFFGSTAGTGAGETVAIVDAYNDPNIITDTQTFDTQWGLQQFNTGGPTLQVLNQNGGTDVSAIPQGQGWALEESLDVQWVHSMTPQANIILFESNTNNNSDMYRRSKPQPTTRVFPPFR